MVFHFGSFHTGIIGLAVIVALALLAFLYPVTRRAIGIAMVVLGLLFSFTIIGYVIGIPMILIGTAMVAVGYFLGEREEE